MRYHNNLKQPSFKQQGWTFWGFLFTATVVIFVAYVGMQLFPVYMGNNSVKHAMELALTNNNPRSTTKAQIISTMQKQMYLDGAHDLVDLRKSMSFKRSRKQALLTVNYGKEVPLFANISLLVKFDNKLEKTL